MNKIWPFDYETSFVPVTGYWRDAFDAGQYSTAGISADGKLLVCGLARSGRLGIPESFLPPGNDLEYYSVPNFTNFLSGDNFTSVQCGYDRTYALSANGKWLATGSNSYGQLGIDTTQWTTGTRQFKKLPNGFDQWPVLRACAYHTLALSGRNLFSVGLNLYGATGHPLSSSNQILGAIPAITAWRQVPGSWAALAEMTSTTEHTIVLSAQSAALSATRLRWFGCGKNQYGELGLGGNTGEIFGMYPIPGNWKRVICGTNRTFALSTNNQWFVAGDNSNGQLGLSANNDNQTSRFAFVPLSGGWLNPTERPNWQTIICGSQHTYALSSNGVWYGCGSNNSGQLGVPPYSSGILLPNGAPGSNIFIPVFGGNKDISKVVTSFDIAWTFSVVPPNTIFVQGRPLALSGNYITNNLK